MHKSATKYNETICKWCKNKHGASKIIDTFETYQTLQGYKRGDAIEANPSYPFASIEIDHLLHHHDEEFIPGL
jgi:hypothetical protein